MSHAEDKVKLWLFLPGRHESFNSATTPTAINGLKGETFEKLTVMKEEHSERSN
jgi:hypothetical protein